MCNKTYLEANNSFLFKYVRMIQKSLYSYTVYNVREFRCVSCMQLMEKFSSTYILTPKFIIQYN